MWKAEPASILIWLRERLMMKISNHWLFLWDWWSSKWLKFGFDIYIRSEQEKSTSATALARGFWCRANRNVEICNAIFFF